MERNITQDLDYINLDKQWKDIFSPYGYSGPLNLKNDEDYNDFKNKLEKYFDDNNIISEFVRFHPLLNTENNFSKENIYKIGKVVYFDLKKSKEKLKNELDNSTRRNIKKARRNGVSLNFDFDLKSMETFKKIYAVTMDRVGAEPSYYFSDKYFSFIRNNLKENSFIVNVKRKNKVIASSLFFATNGIIQYHLGGSKSEYLKYRPNDLLFFEVALWGKENNFRYFNLGGGLGGKEDSLFRFKKSFSENTKMFYVGKKILNKDKYNYLKNEWTKQNEDKNFDKIDFFPIYRK